MSARVPGILDIPDEMLLEIFLHFKARERVGLANVCERFDRLIFSERKLISELDFSEEGRLTTVSDIQRYFGNENTNKLIRKVDLRNVICMEPERLLSDFISKALNLVEINMHGIKFKDLQQLSLFLKPLVLVRRLSIDWPEDKYIDDIPEAYAESFSRLKYLSVETSDGYGEGEDADRYDENVTAIRNLECIEFHGFRVNHHADIIDELLSDPADWTQLLLPETMHEDCIVSVKNLEICEVLREIFDGYYGGWKSLLIPGELLKAVIRLTQTGIPEEFFLKNSSEFASERPECLLRMEDTKLLLKNPRHQIKYLYLSYSIGTKCESHFYSFACQSVTELYFHHLIQIKKSASQDVDMQEKNRVLTGNDIVPSFAMFVENTPLVADLTLNGEDEALDADSMRDLHDTLSLIPGWKNLRSLRLKSLLISDGKFLIEIGKHCKFLERLEIVDVDAQDGDCCYAKDLMEMLSHCSNLTNFSMGEIKDKFEVSEMFLTLANNLKLKRVSIENNNETYDILNIISSVEQLLRCCSKLTTFFCNITKITKVDAEQLGSVIRRLRTELNRPSLQFRVTKYDAEDVIEDRVIPSFPFTQDL